jgi:hypothetical protein
LEGLRTWRRDVVLRRVLESLSASALSACGGTAAMLALRCGIARLRLCMLLWLVRLRLLVLWLVLWVLLLVAAALVLGSRPAKRHEAERSGKHGAEEG